MLVMEQYIVMFVVEHTVKFVEEQHNVILVVEQTAH